MSGISELGDHLQSFFTDYLVAQRGVSQHTVLSYRDGLKLFLEFAAKRLSVETVELTMDRLTVDLVLAFLDHLQQERRNTASTRNVRLAALHVFYRYVASRDPSRFALCQRVLGIPLKHTTKPSIDYLEREEVEAVLKAIDRAKPVGRRDYALLCLFYQTGARVNEVLSLRAYDLQLEPPPHVRLWGKGGKERVIPLWTQTAALLRALLEERNVDPRTATPVFINTHGRPLTRWGVRHILNKYAKAAVADGSTIAKKRVHPHTLRHTTAVHMLQAGADPNAIRDVLGHSSSATTWRYARINMEMKRKTIESCSPESSRPNAPVPAWRRDDDLLAQLEAIGRDSINVECLGKSHKTTKGCPDETT